MQPHIEAQVRSLMASLKDYFSKAEKQEDLRRRLALATKAVNGSFDEVERDYAVVTAFFEDPIPAMLEAPARILPGRQDNGAIADREQNYG
jgi:hypothetical protein